MPRCKRGEIWYVDLKVDRLGHEIDKERPAVVVSNDVQNQYNSMVTVVPITNTDGKLDAAGKPKRQHDVLIYSSAQNGLSKNSVAKCDQIRAIDQSRLGKNCVGKLDAQDMEEIEEALLWSLHLYETN